MVEQWTHKPLVVGSNPTLATKKTIRKTGRFCFSVLEPACGRCADTGMVSFNHSQESQQQGRA